MTKREKEIQFLRFFNTEHKEVEVVDQEEVKAEE